MWLSKLAEQHHDWHLDPGTARFYAFVAAHVKEVRELKMRTLHMDTQRLQIKTDNWWPQYSLDTTYRVSICDTTKRVEVICFGIGSLANTVTGRYASEQQLPEWLQKKLSVLRILSDPPPIEDIENVGRRLGPTLFWIYHT
jgi:hypothetical protein